MTYLDGLSDSLFFFFQAEDGIRDLTVTGVQTCALPILFGLGQASLLEDAYGATGWLLVGLLQIFIMVAVIAPLQYWRDRKSTRLNSSHSQISYAVFCLKKKKTTTAKPMYTDTVHTHLHYL